MTLSYRYFLQALPFLFPKLASYAYSCKLSSNLQSKDHSLFRFIFDLSNQKMGCYIPRERTKQLTLLFNSCCLASGHRLRGGRTNRNHGGTEGFGDLQGKPRLEEAHIDPEAQDGCGTEL